jgi:tetratricopeptide (TPR) repeat protein
MLISIEQKAVTPLWTEGMKMKQILIVLIGSITISMTQAQGWIEQPSTFWKDEQFQKAFMGSYGTKAEIEPRITVLEKQVMEKVLKHLSAENETPKAIELLMKSITPASSAIFEFTLANLYFQDDKLDDALKYYSAAIAKFPSFQRAHKNKGLIHIRQGKFEEALAPLTQTMELGAADGMTYGLLGYAYASTEQHVCAESAYRQAILLQPKTMDWRLGLCRSLFKQQKYGEAIALCDDLLKITGNKPDYLLLQANAYLGMKQPMRAAEIYEILDLSGKLPVAALQTLGDIYVNERLLAQAATVYQRILQRDANPDLTKQLRNVEVLMSRTAYQPASSLLTAIIAKTNNQTDEQKKRILKMKARLAGVRNEVGDEQVKILTEIVSLDPLDGETLLQLGQYYASRDMEKAIFYYERAAALEAFEADAKLRQGQLLVKNGKYQQALPLLKRALELKPREEVQRYTEQVERAARRNG